MVSPKTSWPFFFLLSYESRCTSRGNVYQEDIAASLESLTALEAGQGELLQAAGLWGAAEALREAIGAPMHPVHRASYAQVLAHAQRLMNRPFASHGPRDAV
jgi:hypothetical protein